MCRVLYLPPRVRPSVNVLADWLNKLTESFGGDGIGYATPSMCKKGLNLFEEKVAASMCALHSQAVVFHTRQTSVGNTCNELCHPFGTGRGFLIHNGHWSDGEVAAMVMPGIVSDTAVAAEIIRRYGWNKFTAVCKWGGVWIHLTKRGRQVHYSCGSLFVETETGALCSEPCKAWGNWKPAERGTYGQKTKVRIDTSKPKTETKTGSVAWYPAGDDFDAAYCPVSMREKLADSSASGLIRTQEIGRDKEKEALLRRIAERFQKPIARSLGEYMSGK